jgi:hypothetical protein
MTVEGGRDREDAIELSNKVEAHPGREHRVRFTKGDTGTTAAYRSQLTGAFLSGHWGSLTTTILPGERHFVGVLRTDVRGFTHRSSSDCCRERFETDPSRFAAKRGGSEVTVESVPVSFGRSIKQEGGKSS